MDAQLKIIHEWQSIIDMAVQSVTSPHSQRAYRRALAEFMDWYQANGSGGFNKATVNAYRESLLQAGKSASSINQALSAIRKLAAEASDNGLIPPALAYGIERVKSVKQDGIRAGNWLDRQQAEELVNEPARLAHVGDLADIRASRDQAILAVMIGTGLRRSEVAALTFEHIQQRDGRWVIVDMTGKGGRIRSVGVPAWVKLALDEWAAAAEISSGVIFRAINKGGSVTGDGITSQAIYAIVQQYGLAAHDLRRTSAALALKGGADIRQIQQMLGHASVTTTERYLEPIRSLQVTAGDYIHLEVGHHV